MATISKAKVPTIELKSPKNKPTESKDTFTDRAAANAFLKAAAHNDIKTLETMIEKFPDIVNVRDKYNRTALMLAALMVERTDVEHTDAFDLLMKAKNVDMLAADSNNGNILHIAAARGNIPLAKQILEANILEMDINTRVAATGRTALMLSAMYNYTDMVKLLLLQDGIDIDARDRINLTAEGLARGNRRPESAEILREAKKGKSSCVIM